MPPKGQLFVVATPIGNLSDLTPRAVEALRASALVAAEDTRRTLRLLTHLGLRKPLLRCDAGREFQVYRRILEALGDGQNVALVTDAGTPALSDPGAKIVHEARRAGYTVVPLPGPSAITTALSACGFTMSGFRFFGFLPRKGRERKEFLQTIACEPTASVLFESPFRIARTLADLASLAPTREACIAREMSKLHEEFISAPLAELAAQVSTKPPKGEFTLVVAPIPRRTAKEEE